MSLPIDERRYEILAGEIVYMSPSPAPNHSRIIASLWRIFDDYFSNSSCEPFINGVDVHLDEDNVFIPDLIVVCDPEKVKDNGVHGTPDLVVEVLSPSTAKNDFGYKKDAYARYGVKEYWIISPIEWSIQVYVLKDGQLEIYDVYTLLPTSTVELMKAEEREKLVTEFHSILFPNLKVTLSDVFRRVVR